MRLNHSFLLAALTTALVAAPAANAQESVPAQVSRPSTPPAAAMRFPLTFLSLLRDAPYDAAARGPLLVVVPAPFPPVSRTSTEPNRLRTLTGLGTAADMRLVSAGRMNAFVPRTMAILTTKPGRANPFGDLNASETLKLLLATFTPAQWQRAGSASGIGAGDLTDDQLPLWTQILPEQAQVQKSIMRAGSQPGSWNSTESSQIETRPRETGRLRLSKVVDFSFYRTGAATDTSWSGDPYHEDEKDGATKYHFPGLQTKPGTLPNSAYGVQLITPQSRRLKTGAVDFAAPVLDPLVPLTNFPPRPAGASGLKMPNIGAGAPPEMVKQFTQAYADLAALPTVGEILARVSQETNIAFVADRRVRDLPVYLRGNPARAGDLLSALCWATAGAFRKMEPGGADDTAPLYLLTDDVEGVGARVARLSEWGEAADELKRRITEKAVEAAAKNDPLSHLSFAPGDPFALSATQVKRIEDKWRATEYGTTPDMLSGEMPPALRQAVQHFADERSKDGVSLRTDRVRVGQTVKAFLLLPEVKGVDVDVQELNWAIGGQYAQRVAFDKTKKPAAPKPAPAKTAAPAPPPLLGFKAPTLKKQRRVLVARPANEAEAAQIVRAAMGRGITDVWLEASLADPGAAEKILTAGIRAGGTQVAVGGLVRLLKNGMPGGAPDVNILGETGEAFRTRRIAEYRANKQYVEYLDSISEDLAGFTGWTVPDPKEETELRRRVTALAATPGLAGLTFRATGGPGWTGEKRGGDALHTNTAQGYTPAMRRAFLRERGIDPIDIPEQTYSLSQMRWTLGYFGETEGRSGEINPRGEWWAFRKRKNTSLLAGLFKAVRKTHPQLPLYLDDQISSYAQANTDWFGSWDTPEGLPDFGPYSAENEVRLSARQTSKQIFAHWGWWWGESAAAKPDAPLTFARAVSAAALRNAPPAWDGLILDMSGVAGASLVNLLGGLPKTP